MCLSKAGPGLLLLFPAIYAHALSSESNVNTLRPILTFAPKKKRGPLFHSNHISYIMQRKAVHSVFQIASGTASVG